MDLMVVERNELVIYGVQLIEVVLLGVGLQVGFLGQSGETAEIAVGQPLILEGAWSADRDLINAVGAAIPEGIVLTLTRSDQPGVRVISLSSPLSEEQTFEPLDGSVSDEYRETGTFRVDLMKFFKLPQTPMSGSLAVTLGPLEAQKLDFRIVP